MFSFLNFNKYFRKVFETPVNGWQNMVEFTHLISKEGDNNKCYVKFVFWKVFKNSMKLLASPFFVILQTFSTQRALKRHSKGPGNSGNRRTLGQSRHLSTWALRYLGTQGTRGTLFSRFTKPRMISVLKK